MTITVRGPGGVTVNFPDGTDHATIDKVMTEATASAQAPDLQSALATKAAAYRDANGLPPPEAAQGIKGDRLAAPTAGPNYAEPKPDVPGWESALAGGVDALTFGFADELSAGLKTGAGLWGNYDQTLQEERARLQSEQEANPAEYFGGQVAGAVGTAVALPGIGPLRTLGTLGRIGEGVATGAGYGALYGAGSANGSLADLGRGAVVGAGIGGASGGLGAGAVEGLTSLGRAVGSRAGATWRGVTNPDAEAARRVAVARAADDRTGQPRLNAQDEATAALNNQPVLNIDRGGETTRALGRSAANTSPEGRATLSTAVENRFETQGDRTVDTVRRIVGGNTTADSREALIQSARTANRPAYARAYAAPEAQAMWDQGLEQLASAPVVQDAIRQATVTGRNAGALNGFPPVRNPFTVDPTTGRLTLAADAQGNRVLPNLQFWDHVKRNLDKVGTGEAQQASRVLRDHLDQLVPAYNQARSGAARAFGAQDALEAGDQFVMSRMENNEARRALGQMSPAERQLFAEGFADSLVRKVQETGDRRNVVNAVFGSRASRERVRIALGPQRADELEAFLRVETLMDRARTAVTGNSTTARQLAELGLAGGAGLAMSGGNVFDPRFYLTAALVRGGRAGARAIDSRVAQRVATMLASPDPAIVRRGVQIVARSDQLFSALRRADVPAAVAGSQAGVSTFGAKRQPQRAVEFQP